MCIPDCPIILFILFSDWSDFLILPLISDFFLFCAYCSVNELHHCCGALDESAFQHWHFGPQNFLVPTIGIHASFNYSSLILLFFIVIIDIH